MAERNWPECQEPTAQQLADYLEGCTNEELQTFAVKVLLQAGTAAACYMADHQGRIADLEQRVSREALKERLRIAWWIRAPLTGPINSPEKRTLLELADLLETEPGRWADAPAVIHRSSPNWRRNTGGECD